MNYTTCIAIYYYNNTCVGHQKFNLKRRAVRSTSSAGMLKLSI